MSAPLSALFRKATQRDAKDITRIYLDCFSKWEARPELIPRHIRDRITDDDFNVIVAEDKPGHIAGFIIANCSYTQTHGVMNIDVMAVDKDARRLGLGRQLMHMGEMVARNAGAIAETLQVVEENEPAQKLYLSIGFNVAAKRKHYYSDGTNAFEMVKFLKPSVAANDDPDRKHPAVQRPEAKRRFML